MALEITALSEVSQRDGEISFGRPLWVESIKNDTDELTCKTETGSQTRNWWLSGGRKWGRDHREFGMDMYTRPYLKRINNKDQLCNTWNSVQCFLAAWIGGVFEGEWIYVYVWLGLPGDKEFAYNAGDLRDANSIPSLGRSPWVGNGNRPSILT